MTIKLTATELTERKIEGKAASLTRAIIDQFFITIRRHLCYTP